MVHIQIVAIVATYVALVQSKLDCTPGTEWTEKNIRYRCLDESVNEHGYEAIGCATNNNPSKKDHIAVGKYHQDKNFKYSCWKDGEVVHWEIVACKTPKGTLMEPGTTANEDGGVYICDKDEETKVVSRVFNKDNKCSNEFDGGKSVKLKEKFATKDTVYFCKLYKKKLQMVPWGCVTDSGEQVGSGKYATIKGKKHLCSVNYKAKTSQFVEIAGGCMDQNSKEQAPNAKWIYNDVQYQCKVQFKKGKVTAKIDMKGCYVESKYKKGKKDKVEKLVIKGGSAKKAKDGNFYHCKKNGRETYGIGKGKKPKPGDRLPYDKAQLLKLKKDQYTCENGKTIGQSWSDNGVAHSCKWKKGAPKLSEEACLDAKGKKVKPNKIKADSDKSAVKCEKTDGGLKLRQLSEEEYRAWKSRGKSVSGSGSSGSGIKALDEDGNPICEDGYELDEEAKECNDVNECTDGDPCNKHETCENTPGSYECKCDLGYARNEETDQCEDATPEPATTPAPEVEETEAPAEPATTPAPEVEETEAPAEPDTTPAPEEEETEAPTEAPEEEVEVTEAAEAPVDDEPVNEEPVDEEPVDEEPVDEQPVEEPEEEEEEPADDCDAETEEFSARAGRCVCLEGFARNMGNMECSEMICDCPTAA